MNGDCARAAKAIRGAACAVAVTGAGMSAESGIPTFRGEGGLWEKYPPEVFASIDAYKRDPDSVWKFWRELAELIKDCQPNPGHFALAELEQRGLLAAVITQNVDNLHQEAGSRRVIEYHGNARDLICLSCRARTSMDTNGVGEFAPRCARCGGLMKPGIVMFGEDIPRHALFEAHAWGEKCDVLIVIGTSGQVYPAAQLPYEAKSNGAFIIEVNTVPTEFTSTVTDVFLEGPCGQILPRLLETWE